MKLLEGSFLAWRTFLICCMITIPVEGSITISNRECGETKGCWFEPQNCIDDDDTSDCDYLLTWQPDGDGLIIEMATLTTNLKSPVGGAYISVGFSHDQFMGEDSVVECVSNPSSEVRAFISFDDDTHNERLHKASHAMLLPVNRSGESPNIIGGVVDGQLRCRIKRLYRLSGKLLGDEVAKVFDVEAHEWQLLMAKGSASAFQMHIHHLWNGDLFPWVARHKINVTSHKPALITRSKHYVNDIPRSSQYYMTEAHGIIMLLAWWVIGGVAVIISRHFKKSFPRTKLFGTTVWYQLHRDLFILSVILQVAAIILVFVQNAGWLGSCTRACKHGDYALVLHTILGTVASVAAFIQPFIAWIRPKPTAPYRSVFNYLHWFLGMGSFLLATVTMFMSLPLGKTGLQRVFGRKPETLMGIYVAGYILANMLLELINILISRKGKSAMRPFDPLLIFSGPISMTAKVGDSFKQAYSVPTVSSNVDAKKSSLSEIELENKISDDSQNGTGAAVANGSNPKFVSKKQVAEHNSDSDCWIILDDRVYDVSSYLDEHPGGGEAILEYAGSDATWAFGDVGHSDFAQNLRRDYLIGEIQPGERRRAYIPNGSEVDEKGTEQGNESTEARRVYFESLKLIILGLFAALAIGIFVGISVMIKKVHEKYG